MVKKSHNITLSKVLRAVKLIYNQYLVNHISGVRAIRALFRGYLDFQSPSNDIFSSKKNRECYFVKYVFARFARK